MRVPFLTTLLLVVALLPRLDALAAEEARSVPNLQAQPPVSVPWDALGAAGQVVATGPLGAFAQETGSRWSVLDYSPGALAPRLALGSGLDLGRPVSDVTTAEELALDLIRTYPDLFATTDDRLAVWRSFHGAGKYAVHFWEVVGGFPVLGTKVTAVFTRDGVLAGFGSSTFPSIVHVDAPVLGERRAFDLAHAHLTALGAIAPDPLDVSWRAEGPYVLPIVAGGPAPSGSGDGIHDGDRIQYRDAEGRTIRRIVLWSEEPMAVWSVDVDAVSGEVLQRRNGIFHLDFSGTVTVDVEDPNYCEGAVLHPLSEVEVRVDGVGTVLTDANGDFLLANPGTEPADLEISLRGPWLEVTNVDGPSALYQEVATPGVPSEILIDSATARWDERDVFFHTIATHRMMKGIDADWDDLDFVMPARVNIDQGCNAFYSFADSSINFYRERNGCGNTGQIGDVIAHEYGHAITAELYGPNQPGGDLHEGNSDITANLLFGYSLIGPGFVLDDCENGIRDSDNSLVWPDDVTGSGHFSGQILAGFYWNTLQYLIATEGEEAAFAVTRDAWYFGRLLGLPQTQPEQAWYSILADDDNGNIDDGTPHFAALCQAAMDKGYDCPETFEDVVIRHVPRLYAAMLDGDHRIGAEIYSLAGALEPGEVNAHWRISGGGAFTPVAFAPTGEGNLQEAFIPEQAVLTSVDYFVLAEDEFGNTLRRPAGTGHYTFQVVTAYHNCETGDEGWTVGDPEDTATTGIWERIDPNQMIVGGRIAQPGHDASPDPGVLAWITQQYNGGSPVLSDVDGTTTLFSPSYDLTGSAWVNVQFMRWFQTLSSALGTMEVGVTYDGGESWVTLQTLSPSDASDEWELFSSVVPEPLGGFGTVQFRIVAIGAANPSIDEYGLDEWVLIASDSGSPASVEDTAALLSSVSLSVTSANPTRGLAELEYRLPSSGPAAIGVYGVDGRRVRTLLRGEVEAGNHSLVWDGRDELGNAVGSGVYFVRLRTPDGEDVRRVVIGR